MCFYHFQKQNSTCKCCSSEEKLLWVLNLVRLCYVLHSYTIYNNIPQLFFSPNQLALWMIIIYFFVMYVGVSRNARSHRLRKNVLFQVDKKSKQSLLVYFFFNNVVRKICVLVLSVDVLYFFSILIFYCCSPSKDALEFPISDTYFNFANY